ncbi:MAG TPA: DUF4215 domain-containing protein [Kofleriaceae bacterium]|jgi:cysteine-rich repeat protein
MGRVVVAALAVLWICGCGDDSGLVQKHEDCAHPGDEDGNGLADCDDPACLEAPECTSGSQCGDSLTEGDEQCDDGNRVDGDGCDSNCTYTACGNGIMTAGEACDDGNTVDGDGCDSNCQPTGCGNGERAGTEQCDDGNLVDGDGCEHDCTLPSCGNGIVDPGEDCDDGNTASGDGCDATCHPDRRVVAEVEPNDDGTPDANGDPLLGNDFDQAAMANADANDAFDTSHDLLIQGAIMPAGDEDVFAITNSGATTVVVDFDVWNQGLGPDVRCGDTPDTAMAVRDSNGNLLAGDDDRDYDRDRCSFSRGFVLAPGDKVYAQVLAYGDDSTFVYDLGVTVHHEVCGDHYTTPDEQCDDGNTTAGDGCDATCHVEGATAEAEPDDTIATATPLVLPAIGTGSVSDGDADLFAFTLAADATVAIETFTAEWTCAANISLDLWDSGGTSYGLSTTTPGTYGCSHLTVALPAGTYYAVVQGLAGAYLLAVTALDDAGAELEPNDSYPTATDATGLTTVIAGTAAPGDEDYYAITVPAGAAVRAEIVEGPGAMLGDCDSDALGSQLTLYDASGTAILAREDSHGRGTCALVSGLGDEPTNAWARNATGATAIWYLAVDDDGSGATSDYRLAITVR